MRGKVGSEFETYISYNAPMHFRHRQTDRRTGIMAKREMYILHLALTTFYHLYCNDICSVSKNVPESFQQGRRRSLWDRGDMSPNIYEGGNPW